MRLGAICMKLDLFLVLPTRPPKLKGHAACRNRPHNRINISRRSTFPKLETWGDLRLGGFELLHPHELVSWGSWKVNNRLGVGPRRNYAFHSSCVCLIPVERSPRPHRTTAWSSCADLLRFPNLLREDIPKKYCCSFGFCPNEGRGGRALPKFFVTFS